ncbi:penicillin-binding protein 1C [Bernardetia litoralis DSM 6794]|uniref:peptidoglycan glycosyltransferase n=1 Tax=Bernardetia litoralis (strain ATCC 23117 / DSM 6794 / NBRC 15988 / NCIMB 1366 / Fx l1 / Sio-4) TaxID=880071 RepID=I4AQU9_BERLS|nr:penicillin-binding protein 1C [Bernardetia litoralis]AFM06334.1 penicillin-binding protein 1C [Bernardetia litoralis DSM 6794]
MIKQFLKRFFKLSLKISIIGLLSTVILFFVFNYFFPFKLDISYSQLILGRKGEIIYGFLSKDDKWRFQTELNEISPTLKETILYKEDRYFYYHFGVNPFAVGRAAAKNIWTGRRTSGASTITMQVVRLLNPKSRTYFNKIIEMFRAFQLEFNYSKEEILQLYLNLIPYGGNIEGVKSASLLYFGQEPEKLSLAQITALTIVPNRPTTLGFSTNSDKDYLITTQKIIKERNKWLARFKKDDLFKTETIKDALEEPLDINFRKMSREAPHFSFFLHSKYPNQNVLETTLDRTIQQKVEQITQNYTRRLDKLGIYNAAILVVDNQTKEIRAYIGSQDFYDSLHSGQVDGVQAYRSPGSTLKPLIYGMAFDEGFLTPKQKLLDVPIDYDGYTPENFDKNFNGEVSVEVALAYSLNVPAVNTLKELSVFKMVQKLSDAGFSQIEADKHKLGLSLSLGGCGVSLEEMVGLFSAFSTKGIFKKPHYLKQNNTKTNKSSHSIAEDNFSFPLISEESAYMVSDILTKVERPDFPSDYQNSKNVPKISWKTGTSYGRRDAWSIGYNAHYTIGVWIGNFDGQSSKYLTGAQVATPLLFQLFGSVDYAATNESIKPPKTLKQRMVCSETGKVPSDFCTTLVNDFYIPTISQSDKCQHLKKIFVSNKEVKDKISYCSFCLPQDNSEYTTEYFPNIKPELTSYYLNRNLPIRSVPSHNPFCTHIFKDNNFPQITSLFENREYILDDDSTQLLLECRTASDISSVFWYVNDKFLKESKPNERVFFNPFKFIVNQGKNGKTKISCTDNKGRNTDIWIRLKRNF